MSWDAYDIVFPDSASFRWWKRFASEYPSKFGTPLPGGGWRFPSDPRKGRIAQVLHDAGARLVDVKPARDPAKRACACRHDPRRAMKKKKSAKFERCVRSVKKRSPRVNPWAVCHASLKKRSRRDLPKPSRKAWQIVQFIHAHHASPNMLAKTFGLSIDNARYLVGLAAGMFGPGGRGEEAYARSVDRVLRGWWERQGMGARDPQGLGARKKARRRRDAAYGPREVASFLAELRRIEKAPLADRQESARAFAKDLRSDPALIAERVRWLLDGSYGYGAMVKAKQVLSSRMNKVAWFTQTVGAIEWHCPFPMSAAAWKKLSAHEKDVLERHVLAALS